MATKKVSVVIPARNEAQFIGRCLDSLLAQTYPKEQLEIFVVDGASTDSTREIVASYQKQHPYITLLENNHRFTPFGMNIGIHAATGDFVMIGGAHAHYASDYIEKCVKYSDAYNADNVGGVLKTLPAVNTRSARAIALVLQSTFGAGNARFRTGATKPMWADTVFGGFYRKEIFQKVGYINEKLTRSQDMDFSIRLKKAGGRILLVPDLIVEYYPKATMGDFLAHNIKDGIWAILPMKFGGAPFKLRHLLPLAFILGLTVLGVLSLIHYLFFFLFIAAIIFYFGVSVLVSATVAIRERQPMLLPFLVLAFAIRHFGYGLGSLIGVVRLTL